MKWINAGDPQADSAEIAKICGEQEAECGEVYITQYYGNYHHVFCGKCGGGFYCNNENKCEKTDTASDNNEKCTNGTFKCHSPFVSHICQDGEWRHYEECPEDEICDDGTGQCALETGATREMTCTNLPENAEWNTVVKITQTWNGEEYIPSNEGTFNEEASTTECRFKCISGTEWTGSSCITSLTWSKKADAIYTWEEALSYCDNLTESGYTDWRLPNIDELMTLLINVDRVLNNCQVSEANDCLSWNDCWSCSTCTETGTQSSNGTSCDDWSTYYYEDGRYSKLGDAGWFCSSSVVSDDSDYAWCVDFTDVIVEKSDKHYSASVRCVKFKSDSDTDTEPVQTNPCDSNPCSSVANSTGSCTVIDETDFHMMHDYSCGCNEHYNWNDSTLKCEPETQTFYCADKPENSTWNSVSSYTQTWDGTGWSPTASTTSYNETASSTECRFKCNSGYEWDETKCKLKELPECSSESTIPCKDSSTSLMWSSANTSGKDWDSAVDYCSNLNEEGYHDWHLPTIDELRTLIQNCPNTETGGPCKVTNSCLSSSCRNDDYCNGCGVHNDGSLSKLGNSDLPSYGDPRFWSSSVNSGNTNSAWEIVFSHANINSYSKTEKKYVRCVRKY